MHMHKTLVTAIFIALTLSGCSGGVKQSLGLEKESPDEFAVITRAPLEMPEYATLPPPVPGMPRPQESAAVEQAKNAVFGNKKPLQSNVSAAEQTLLKNANATAMQDDIRAVVNRETAELTERNKPVAEKLISLGGNKQAPSATIVDAEKEAARIKENMAKGNAITTGETPYIEE